MIRQLKVLTASGRDGLRPVRSIWPRWSATLPLCSEVLASTDYPIRFSPVVDALCRLSPRNRVTKGRIHRYQRSRPIHPLTGKTTESYHTLPSKTSGKVFYRRKTAENSQPPLFRTGIMKITCRAVQPCRMYSSYRKIYMFCTFLPIS